MPLGNPLQTNLARDTPNRDNEKYYPRLCKTQFLSGISTVINHCAATSLQPKGCAKARRLPENGYYRLCAFAAPFFCLHWSIAFFRCSGDLKIAYLMDVEWLGLRPNEVGGNSHLSGHSRSRQRSTHFRARGMIFMGRPLLARSGVSCCDFKRCNASALDTATCFVLAYTLAPHVISLCARADSRDELFLTECRFACAALALALYVVNPRRRLSSCRTKMLGFTGCDRRS